MSAPLTNYLAERKARIETHLFACLPALNTRPTSLSEAMCHAVLCGGKRLRPILCLAACEAAGGDASHALDAACAVELLHTYTLVHDDLPCMDNDLLRRGQPTVHAKYGEALAVLVGDALQTLAFEILARTPEAAPGTIAQLVTELARSAGAQGVIAGQVEDIAYAGTPTRDIVDYVFQHKTADLFAAAIRLGARVAAATPATLNQLTTYANNLGIAFQVIDDLLDAHEAKSDEKPELSCLDIMSEADARLWAQQLTEKACLALRDLPGETAPLEALARELLSRVI